MLKRFRNSNKEKETNVFKAVKNDILSLNLHIQKEDLNRPWGAFFLINEDQIEAFLNYFFISEDKSRIKITGRMSPKILVIKPFRRLSWQYHKRRSEVWKVVEGEVDIVTSESDVEGPKSKLKKGETLYIEKEERHRIIGLTDYSIIAEIWQHTDSVPSDEDDIVRIKDDFNRK